MVHNRTEGELGKRLDGFTLKILDKSRREAFAQSGIPAPTPKAEIAVPGGGPAGVVRRAVMAALVSVRGEETKSFATLAKFVRDDIDRQTAIRASSRCS